MRLSRERNFDGRPCLEADRTSTTWNYSVSISASPHSGVALRPLSAAGIRASFAREIRSIMSLSVQQFCYLFRPRASATHLLLSAPE
eukprot:scaffold1696_cov258-Pinguiococcus_pyrenoidosus.AAC.26